jgi:hypothetical protein
MLLPVFFSRRRHPDDQSISCHRRPHASSRRNPVKAINLTAVAAAWSSRSRNTAPRRIISSGESTRSFATAARFSIPRHGFGPLTNSRFAAHDQIPPKSSAVRAATPAPPSMTLPFLKWPAVRPALMPSTMRCTCAHVRSLAVSLPISGTMWHLMRLRSRTTVEACFGLRKRVTTKPRSAASRYCEHSCSIVIADRSSRRCSAGSARPLRYRRAGGVLARGLRLV